MTGADERFPVFCKTTGKPRIRMVPSYGGERNIQGAPCAPFPSAGKRPLESRGPQTTTAHGKAPPAGGAGSGSRRRESDGRVSNYLQARLKNITLILI
jgi:hypothetical protein